MNALVYVDIDQSIRKVKLKFARKENLAIHVDINLETIDYKY